MSTQKRNAELPESEAARLRELRKLENQASLQARIIALRDKGWPLRAIGTAIDVSRMSIQVWETRSRENPEIVAASKIPDVPDLPIDARGSGIIGRKMRPDVPELERERLRKLAASAKTVRRWTRDDAPERRASDELDELLVKYVKQRRITPMAVSRHAGVTRRAIVARLERIEERQKASA